jgi:hypothetical protein
MPAENWPPKAYVVTQGPDGLEKEILGASGSLDGAKILASQVGSKKPIGWDQTLPHVWWGTGTDLFIHEVQYW